MANEEKLIENMGVVSDKLVQYMDAAEKVITQYGGDAVNLGLNVLRIDAGVSALAWITGFLLCISSALAFKALLKKYTPSEVTGVDFGLGGIVVVFVFSTMHTLIEPIVWPVVGIFWPEAYAVHKFLM